MEKITSRDLIKMLESTFNEARKICSEVGITDVRIIVWSDTRGTTFQIDSGSYSSERKVEGRDFWQCVDEFIRRDRFAEQQRNLLLEDQSNS